MANTIRIKRRASGGGTGAPTTLQNAELAFNEETSILYYGTGTGGANGSATQVIAIGGDGAFATKSYVTTAISDVIGAAPSALNTLNELAQAINNDSSFASTITTSLSGKLSATSNLSDLANAGTARSNLGLGSLATQASNNVSITGGSIDGVTIDCGTF